MIREIVRQYTDTISGAKSKRPVLDQLLVDATRHRFDVVLVAGFDRVARNARHFLEVLDELAIAELEKSLIVERVKAGMRRARLEGRRWAVGRAPLIVDRAAIVLDRLAGLSLTKVSKKHRVSRATACLLVNASGRPKKN